MAQIQKSQVIQGTVERRVVVQKWEESERGLGTRPDGFTMHQSEQHRQAYINAYVDEKTYAAVVASGNGMWGGMVTTTQAPAAPMVGKKFSDQRRTEDNSGSCRHTRLQEPSVLERHC